MSSEVGQGGCSLAVMSLSCGQTMVNYTHYVNVFHGGIIFFFFENFSISILVMVWATYRRGCRLHWYKQEGQDGLLVVLTVRHAEEKEPYILFLF